MAVAFCSRRMYIEYTATLTMMQRAIVLELLLLLVLVCLPALASDEEGECVVGSDGEQVCKESSGGSSSSPTMDLLSDENCIDGHEKCAFWASAGECKVS